MTGQSVDSDVISRPARHAVSGDINIIHNERRFLRSKRDGSGLKEKEDIKKDCNVDKFESLNVGCTGTSDTMEFHSSCGSDSNSGNL